MEVSKKQSPDDGGSSGEESDEQVSGELKLNRLLDRKEELIENLNGVDASLAKLGYHVDNRATKEAKRQLQSRGRRAVHKRGAGTRRDEGHAE